MKSLKTAASAAATQVIVLLVRAYRLGVSPLLPPRCRHWPTCSAYFIEAVEGHGALRGGYFGVKRILRCHPWGTSGFDPVPPAPDADKHESLEQRAPMP